MTKIDSRVFVTRTLHVLVPLRLQKGVEGALWPHAKNGDSLWHGITLSMDWLPEILAGKLPLGTKRFLKAVQSEGERRRAHEVLFAA
jgi:hypothetical protein